MLFSLQQDARVYPCVSSQLRKDQNLNEGRGAARTGRRVLTPPLEDGLGYKDDLAEYPFSAVVRPSF